MIRRTARPLTTSRGGAITFRGVSYATEAELERALAEALSESGRRVTADSAATLDGLRAWRSGEAA